MPSDPHPDTTQRTLLSDGPGLADAANACVVVIHGEGLGRRVNINARGVVVGRSQEADLHIGHPSVSRSHCRIWRDGEHYFIRDLDATNTTRVNEHPIAESELRDGDHIVAGECILKFICRSGVEARYHEEIYQLATLDPLTGLCNRRHFIEMADKEIVRAARHRRALSMCILDVDLFKPINDRYGHISGDGVLRKLASTIHDHARGDDLAARIGGEEFAVLLPECGLDAAQAFAERLRQAIAATPVELGGQTHLITVSIGVAALTAERGNCSRMLAAADAALYRAKHGGRNQVCTEP